MIAVVVAPDPERTRERLAQIVGDLERVAVDRVQRRKHHEDRWLNDMRQYYGRYDETTARKMTEANGSRLFVNLTRAKTNAMSARLMDLLFPTDDRNWGIAPTPVPELTQRAQMAADRAREAQAQLEQAAAAAQEQGQPAPPEMQAEVDELQAEADGFQEILTEARTRSEAMADEIEDILVECRYEAAARDVIEDACKYGTGVFKGPVVGDRLVRRWIELGEGQYQLVMEGTTERPGFHRVDLWSFFPDPDARNIEESEGVYVRHLMKERQLRSLARLPGFSAEAVRRIMQGGAKDAAPQYLVDMRSVLGDTTASPAPNWQVWEYTGPLSVDAMQTLAEAFGDDGLLEDVSEVDPLSEVNAVVWFCQGEVLKFAIHPLDSGEPLFSVFNLEKDDSSIFGYGIPALMRDDQRALNAAWRAMMDNAALGTGPQIVVDKGQVEPADGRWGLSPRKLWYRKEGATRAAVFETYNVEMHQAELANIIGLAKQQIDEVTMLPQVAQGEQGVGVTKTAQGMALLMNSANVIFRRIIKNFDDDFTVPNVRRLYDWLMQFSPKPSIKGDFEVDARGSSVLLVREMQAQNLMALSQYVGHPVFGPAIKPLEVLREVFRAHLLQPHQYVVEDGEYEAAMAAMAQPDEGDGGAAAQDAELKQMEMQLKAELANLEANTRLRVEEMRRETAMMKLAEEMNMTMDQLEARMDMSAAERRSKERIFAAEAAMSERLGRGGGGYL